LQVGDLVNLETDIVGKYIVNYLRCHLLSFSLFSLLPR
jgi:riboflavin synthase alpha subunit